MIKSNKEKAMQKLFNEYEKIMKNYIRKHGKNVKGVGKEFNLVDELDLYVECLTDSISRPTILSLKLCNGYVFYDTAFDPCRFEPTTEGLYMMGQICDQMEKDENED